MNRNGDPNSRMSRTAPSDDGGVAGVEETEAARPYLNSKKHRSKWRESKLDEPYTTSGTYYVRLETERGRTPRR